MYKRLPILVFSDQYEYTPAHVLSEICAKIPKPDLILLGYCAFRIKVHSIDCIESSLKMRHRILENKFNYTLLNSFYTTRRVNAMQSAILSFKYETYIIFYRLQWKQGFTCLF